MNNFDMLTEDLVNYCVFLNEVTQKIDKFFQQQKPYIFCKEGCAKCCQEGAFPCSELEYKLMKLGLSELPDDIKAIIQSKVDEIKKKKQDFKGDNFLYECPFLLDNKCLIYLFRPLVCRAFGLAQFTQDGGLNVPFCVSHGLNYHQVYDVKQGKLSSELFKKTGYKEEPLAYNLSTKFLIKEYGEKQKGLDFGEIKTIIDFM